MSLKGAVRPPTSSKPKKHRLAGVDDVILYTTQQANPVAFLYELECARFSRVNFTLDFSGSRNFYVEPATGGPRGGAEGSEGEDLVLQCIAEPFRRTRVGRLVLADPSRPAELKNTYNWGLEDVPTDIVAQLLAEGKRRMTAAINRVRLCRGALVERCALVRLCRQHVPSSVRCIASHVLVRASQRSCLHVIAGRVAELRRRFRHDCGY